MTVHMMLCGAIFTRYTLRHAHGQFSWWRHLMETFSALLAICAGNSPVTGEFPAQRPVTRGFDIFFDLRLNKRLSKQLWGWWFDTPSRPLWRHCNVIFSDQVSKVYTRIIYSYSPAVYHACMINISRRNKEMFWKVAKYQSRETLYILCMRFSFKNAICKRLVYALVPQRDSHYLYQCWPSTLTHISISGSQMIHLRINRITARPIAIIRCSIASAQLSRNGLMENIYIDDPVMSIMDSLTRQGIRLWYLCACSLITYLYRVIEMKHWSLQWRHDERDGVLNHRRLHWLLNRFSRRRSKKTSKIRVTDLRVTGLHRWPIDSPHKGPLTRKMLPFDDVIMGWDRP